MHINAASAAASAGPGSADGTVAVAANGAADEAGLGWSVRMGGRMHSQSAWQFITVSLTAMASLLALAAAATAAATEAETAASVVAIC